MFTAFKSGFRIGDRRNLNSFASQVVKIAEEYIRYLIYLGKVTTPDNMSAFDIAVDLMGEIFKIEDGCLIHFKNYFDKLDNSPETESEFTDMLKRFVISVTQNNLPQIFRHIDPTTNKILRNIYIVIKEENYITTKLFTDKYIHRKDVDFESAECMDKESLLGMVFKENGVHEHTTKELLEIIFKIVESQKEYLHAVRMNDLLFIMREITAYELRQQFSEEDSDAEVTLYCKLLFDEIRSGFMVKLNGYFKKKNFSEKECECVYNIVDDVINCYISGFKRESVNNLILKHYHEKVTKEFFNKVEYILGLLNTEIISLIQKEEISDVSRLLK